MRYFSVVYLKGGKEGLVLLLTNKTNWKHLSPNYYMVIKKQEQ